MMLFNAEEVYRIGIEIERNGGAFYAQAADQASDTDAKRLFSDLAKWEHEHERLFETLAAKLPTTAAGSAPLDPDREVQRYLKAIADSHVFLAKTREGALAAARACDGPVFALNMAMRFEKDTVVLFTALRDVVPETLGKSTLDRLVREEMGHVALLQRHLAVLDED